MDYFVLVYSEEYIVLNYFKYVGKLIVYLVLYVGFGLIGLFRVIIEYFVIEDVNSCLFYLLEEDILDLDI